MDKYDLEIENLCLKEKIILQDIEVKDLRDKLELVNKPK